MTFFGLTANDAGWRVPVASAGSLTGSLHKLAGVVVMSLWCASFSATWFSQIVDSDSPPRKVAERALRWMHPVNETVASGYIGAPLYHSSDLHLQRPDGTDMTFKKLNWDGDSFYFPIDGGARVIRWAGAFGGMVDFLHNKAVAQLGKGAHGRKISNGVIQDAETTGLLAGKPAPSPLHLTDYLQRLEFTHGHNVLMATGLARIFPIAPNIRPYFGIGFGAAVPHVEVRFTGEKANRWTSEYQFAGPAMQLLAGLELRVGRGSYYVEYKFIWASISAALTAGKSWSLKDLHSKWLPRWFIEPFSGLTEMPGDLIHQYIRWRDGEKPAEGTFQTHLASHELVIGAGYVWPGHVPVLPPLSGTAAP